MKDLGSLQYILGINVQPGTDSVCLNQAAYIEQILKKVWYGPVKTRDGTSSGGHQAL